MTESPTPTPKAQTIAVAGGTGFVGGAIAVELARRGHRVVVLSHRRGLPPALAGRPNDGFVESRAIDVSKPIDSQALAGVDCLVIALAFRNSPVEAPGAAKPSSASTPAERSHSLPPPERPA